MLTELWLLLFPKYDEVITYEIGNPCPDLGQTQKCCGVKSVNGIPTTPLLVIGTQMVIHI